MSASVSVCPCVPAEGEQSGSRPVGNRIVNIESLAVCIVECTTCSNLRKEDTLVEGPRRQGIATDLYIKCLSCGSRTPIREPHIPGSKQLELNRRSVYATRIMGRVHAGLARFCAIMNVPPPVSDSNFSLHPRSLHIAAREEACASMECAGRYVRETYQADEIMNISVSCDGTGMERGFTSMHGVVIVIAKDTVLVIDYTLLTKSCHLCKLMRKLYPVDSDFLVWYRSYKDNCDINFDGSSPAMEAQGALTMFQRSIVKHKLRYTGLIADGDSKTHSLLLDMKPYGDFNVEKMDCIGHVQKRMGTALRKLKRQKHSVFVVHSLILQLIAFKIIMDWPYGII